MNTYLPYFNIKEKFYAIDLARRPQEITNRMTIDLQTISAVRVRLGQIGVVLLKLLFSSTS